MIKEMLKTAGVDNMEDFYKLHPTEEHFFKTYPHMKDKVKKRKKIRKAKYQPGGGVPFTDFAAAQAQGDQAAVDQINQQAAQQYLYSNPVYPTANGRAPGTMSGTLPQVTITAPQSLGKSPREVYQDFYQNVAPYYPLRSIDEYQQSYAATGMPPQYGNVDEAEKRWKDVQHLKNVSNEEYNAAYDNYRRALEGNHRHGDYELSRGVRETDADVYGASKVFNPGMQPYVGPTGTKYYGAWYDWNKVKQGLDTGNYNTDARLYTTMDSHTGHDNDAENQAERQYSKEMRYRNPKFKQTPGVFEQEEYQKGGRTAQEGSQEMLQKIMQLAAQAFQQGASPEKIIKSLVKQGIPEQTAIQMLRMVVDQVENSDESQYGGAGEGIQYQEGMEEGAQETPEEEYARGGGIHLDPAKKGTFTAQATRMGMGVQEAARHILAHKDRYSPGMVKKANFARNASKWKHAYGGNTRMYQEGGETMGQEQMEGAPQQMQEQAMGQEQQQGGQDQMMQQLAQMVAQALQQGMDPQQIVQMLVQQGVPQEVATQVVQMVMQQMGGGAPQGGPGEQYQPQGGQYQGPQGQQPQAAMGGYYANGGINNAGFRALPPSVQQKIMDNMAYGGYYADGGFFNESYMPFDY